MTTNPPENPEAAAPDQPKSPVKPDFDSDDLRALFPHYLDLPPSSDQLDPRLLPSGGGVYAFIDSEGRVIQTLSTQSIRRSATRRLDPADTGKGRADIRAIARRICWIPTHSVFESMWTYLRVARRLSPDTYRKELAFGPVWFASICPEDPFPRWRVGKWAFTPGAIDVGPFERRGQCTDFVDTLQDAFDLCRDHSILVQTPHGEACVYKEMGKCAAPCDGTVSLVTYRGTLSESIKFARGDTSPHLQKLCTAMTRAADDRQYMQAAKLREQIERVEKAAATSGRMTDCVDDFRYLVVQRGAKRSEVVPFFVDRGCIVSGEAVALKKISDVAELWFDEAQKLRDQPENRSEASECVWLVARFLAKGSDAPGLYLDVREIASPDNIALRVREQFEVMTKRPSGP